VKPQTIYRGIRVPAELVGPLWFESAGRWWRRGVDAAINTSTRE
jgi:hypothetical protein